MENKLGSLIFRPWVGYFFGFVLPWILLEFNFVDAIIEISNTTNIIIALSIGSYYCGHFVSAQYHQTVGRVRSTIHVNNDGRLIKVLIAWLLLGLTCLALEFFTVGAIPLFAGTDWERIRFDLKINGYVHLLAISTGMVAVLAGVARVYSSDPVAHRQYLYIAIVGFFAVVLTGNRSDFLTPLVVLLVFYMMEKSINLTPILLVKIIIFVVLFSLIKIVREEYSGSEYIDMMAGQISGNDLSYFKIIVYPIYMTFAYSYQILDRLVLAGASGASSGEYTFYAFYSLLPVDKTTFGDFKNAILGIDFYGELTSTYISNFYLDFGLFGCVVGSFVMGYVIEIIYLRSRSDHKYVIVYAFVFVYLLISFYCFMYYYFYCVLQLAIATLFAKYFLRSNKSLVPL
jgi:oligosaccharide repeat unit polymerase